MSTLSPTQSPSPTLPKALWSIFAFIVIPVLSVIWIVNCLKARRSEWMIFLLFALIGTAEIIFFIVGDSQNQFSHRFLGTIAYIVTLFGQLFFLAIVKDEIDKRKPA